MAKCEDISGETFYQRLINEAPFIPGDHGISPKTPDPSNSELYDKELIEKGKQFVRRNFLGVILAIAVGVLYACIVRRTRVVLLHKGDAHIKEAAFKRYLTDFIHMLAWLQSDFTTQDTHATKDLNAVRNIHRLVARRHSNLHHQLPTLSPDDSSFLQGIQQVTSGIDDSALPQDIIMEENPEVPISQFDFVETQFAFIGPFLLHPQNFGVHDTEGFEGFIRLWSIIGRQLGIEDRFNVALHYEKTGGKTDAFHLNEQRIIMACLKQTDDTALIMWKAILEGISDHIPLVRFKPIVQLVLKTKGLPAHLLDEHMDWRDRVSSFIYNFVLGQITKWAAGRLVCNSACRLFLWIARRIYLKKKNLEKK